MSISSLSPSQKCLEARSLLFRAEFFRKNSALFKDITPLDLDRLQYEAENLAGEAGFEAALVGSTSRVPDCIESLQVLRSAFIAEFTQVRDHLTFEALNDNSDAAARLSPSALAKK